MSAIARIGIRRQHHGSIASTNSHATTFAIDPTNHGLVITADSQTAGRGQYERNWSAPSCSSVLMSVLLFPPPDLRRASILTAWAAVSVCETIRQATGLQPQLKWPNDVLIRNKKVCGILCEGGAQHVVAGIGLNVNQEKQHFEHLGLPTATSMAIESCSVHEVQRIAEQLIQRLDAEYSRLVQGDIAAIESDWKSRFGLLGQTVALERMDGRIATGSLLGLRFDGVEIAMSNGEQLLLAPEAIRHLTRIDPLA